MRDNFLGVGMKFPPEVDRNTGRFRLSSDKESIREAIYIILMTNVGERLTLPEFGSTVSRYAFETMDLTTVSLMERDIRRVILENEPRVADLRANIQRDSENFSKLLIHINYFVIGENTPENMVFPFYPEGAGGAADDIV